MTIKNKIVLSTLALIVSLGCFINASSASESTNSNYVTLHDND